MSTGPPSDPIFHLSTVTNGELAAWVWREDLKEIRPTLVFAHATSFHGRVWDAIIERLPQNHAVALDLRGHGESSGGPIDHWNTISADIADQLDDLNLSGCIGIGHSLGGHAILQCAADRPELFAGLVLFDPVIAAPEYYALQDAEADEAMARVATRRQKHFRNIEEMIARYSDREPFSLLEESTFQVYCRFGLKDAPDVGGMQLSCSPESEAAVYRSSRSNGAILNAAASVDVPVALVRAKPGAFSDFMASATWPGLAKTMRQAIDIERPDMSHFHPLEDPDDAAQIIREFENRLSQ